MGEWFVRHTQEICVSDEDLGRIWEDDRIAVHFPGPGWRKKDSVSLNPNDYQEGSERDGIRRFVDLAAEGGYVWADSRVDSNSKVGKVEPGSRIEFREGTWTYHHPGRPAKMKTIRITKVRTVPPHEWLNLRAGRPRRGTVSRWPNARGNLEALVEGRPPPRRWAALSPEQQETTCAEFLRHHDLENLPHLAHLLLPVGRTLKDVDIYGTSGGGRRLFAQVTFKSKGRAEDKVQALRGYADRNADLVFFCECEKIAMEDGVVFVPVQDVWDWAQGDREYLDAVLRA